MLFSHASVLFYPCEDPMLVLNNYLQITLGDMAPDLLPALSHKNPQVKEGTLKLLTRCVSTSKTPLPPAQVKPLAEALAGLLEDGNEGARNEAATALGTLMKMVGERQLGSIMEGVADLRKAKVKESFEKATVRSKAGGAAPPPKAAPPAAKASVRKAAPPAIKVPEAAAEEAPTPVKKVAKPPARLMVSDLHTLLHLSYLTLCLVRNQAVRHPPRQHPLPSRKLLRRRLPLPRRGRQRRRLEALWIRSSISIHPRTQMHLLLSLYLLAS